MGKHVFCVFNACGKTHLGEADSRFKDLDFSDYVAPGASLEVIHHALDIYAFDAKKESMNSVVLLSSRKDVRDKLRSEGIPYTCVIPEMDCRNEWIERCKARGNSKEFIYYFDKYWSAWIRSLELDNVIKLGKGQYLSDIAEELVEVFNA